MQPNILISGSNVSRANYENAITAAGGTFSSCYLPALGRAEINSSRSDDILSSCNGLLLAGGGDINPDLFGQENTFSEAPDDARDKIELELIHRFMEAGKPILGICRGFQIMNVALGGTLHQDMGESGRLIHASIPTAPATHTTGASPSSDRVHLTRAAEFSFLGQLYGSVFSVNSAHHQSIDRLADPLLAVQWSMEDGCIEGAFHSSYPYIGVQWHPERMCLANEREDTVNGLAVFQYFMKCFF